MIPQVLNFLLTKKIYQFDRNNPRGPTDGVRGVDLSKVQQGPVAQSANYLDNSDFLLLNWMPFGVEHIELLRFCRNWPFHDNLN
jgi:hypothetical protein